MRNNTILRVERINQLQLIAGSGLIALSFLLPSIIHVRNFHVFYFLESALRNQEELSLLMAALQLVTLNTLRSIPHYLGSYLVGESITFRWGERDTFVSNAIIMVSLLILSYAGIWWLHKIHYDFGIPAIVVTSLMLFFRKQDYQHVSLTKKVLQIVPFLTAVQFLDIMPVFGGMPVGRGETSWDIKRAAALLDGEMLLNGFGLIGCTLFILFGILIAEQIREENHLRELNLLKEQNEQLHIQAQVNEMKNRSHQELQYLVHDLKSPLTAMQTLVGMLKMQGERDHRDQEVECLTSVEDSIERMSQMISELLYENSRSLVETELLVQSALAQISMMDFARQVTVQNEIPHALVRVNRVLFVRALVNLIQNAAQASVPERENKITLRVSRQASRTCSWVCFSVEDNGSGIHSSMQDQIWENGVSGHHSSGYGLAFVRHVVEDSGGKAFVKSQLGKGTIIELFLMEGGDVD